MIDVGTFRQELMRVATQNNQLADVTLEEMLAAIPRVDRLDRPPAADTVLVRADLDLPLQGGRVVDASRIESCERTIRYCRDRGWKVVLFGHIGRDPHVSLRPVCEAFSEALETRIDFVPEWLDGQEDRFRADVAQQIADSPPGSLLMLENARRYSVERALWSATTEDVERLSEPLYGLARDVREKVSDTEINESIAASNTDVSSSVIPLAMEQTGLGFFIDREMKEHVPEVRRADFVVFSGLKMNKLDDLEQMIAKRPLRRILVAGALSMPLKKAQARLGGSSFSLGRAESDPGYKGFVEPKRFTQGERIVRLCGERRIDLVLPVDFVLDNGEVAAQVPEGCSQMDVGPETVKRYASEVEDYLRESETGDTSAVMFYNGVFGKFEDPRFETGTREFITRLGEMTRRGVKTYVGGGEGRLALLKYGSVTDVTHAFTSGGTILKCLSDRQIGYLKAMYQQNTRS